MGKYESRLSGTILFPTAELLDRLNEAANFPHFFAAHVFFCFFSLHQRKERAEAKKRKERLQRN